MRKDDLYITVPTFFRCPISLDVMKSPVSLCTGVTYDRASIQRWLDGGNNTCPATMQVLQNKDFIPNRTLQRLIEIWSDSVRRRVESTESALPTRDEISDAIDRVKIEKEERDDREILSKIVRFAKESDDNRGFLAGKDDFVRLLVDLMSQVDSISNPKLLVVQEAVKILSLIRGKISDRRRFSNLILTNGRDRLTTIFLLFKSGNMEMKINCAGLLEIIAIDAESKLLIAERDGLITELLKSIKIDSDSSLIEAILSCLIAISSPKRVKLNLIRLKLIKDLTKLLSDPTTSSVSVTEKCLKLLETLASTKEGRSEICNGDGGGDDGECLKTVVKKLMKVSMAATEHAVTVLWSVCYLFKEAKALEIVTVTNGVTKILLLLQSNCSPSVIRMLTDLLKVFKVNSRSCLSAYDTKTTHIMPF